MAAARSSGHGAIKLRPGGFSGELAALVSVGEHDLRVIGAVRPATAASAGKPGERCA
jgi:hypothetical protein